MKLSLGKQLSIFYHDTMCLLLIFCFVFDDILTQEQLTVSFQLSGGTKEYYYIEKIIFLLYNNKHVSYFVMLRRLLNDFKVTK